MRLLAPTRNPRHRLAVLLLTTALVASPAAFAQTALPVGVPAAAPTGAPTKGGPGTMMQGMPNPMNMMVKKDKDGNIPKAEFLAPAKARFDVMDTNKDGSISRAELLAPAEESFARQDTNKDGKISPEEQKTMMMGMPKGYPMMPPANKPPATASSAPNSQAPAKPAVKSGQ